VCPGCNKTKEKYIDTQHEKMSLDDYILLVEIAKNKNKSLQEDFEICLDENGFFSIDYHCRCSDCGFEYTYTHAESIL